VGDWCETKDRGLHLIGAVGGIRLADPSGRFALELGGLTYLGLLLDHPPIHISALVKQLRTKPGAIHQPHFMVRCRVFKER
jgi:hypothetical protein